jgi:YVTN family beta-propeller protein
VAIAAGLNSCSLARNPTLRHAAKNLERNLESRLNMSPRLLALTATLPIALAVAAADQKSRAPTYEIDTRISAPDALWDYASIDPTARRLYVGRMGGVMAVDLDNRSVIPVLVPIPYVHGIAPVPDSGLAASSNGPSDTVSVFEGKTGRVVATIPTGKNPDAIIVEPLLGLIVTANKESQDLTLIDAQKFVSVGTIRVPGEPEFLAADGHGLVYNNISDKNEIAVIDIAARRVLRTIKLAKCSEPTGLAYDAPDELLISVCANGIANFINAKTGADVATFTVGKGPDAALFDAVRRVALVPSGEAGTLTVISVRSVTDIAVTQTLHTQQGARTGAIDPRTGRVYLPTGKLVPAKKRGAVSEPDGWPSVAPGSFKILVVAPDH